MSISSRWAAEAALTRAEVAAAIDLAASKIISSKLKLSSVSWRVTKNYDYIYKSIKCHLKMQNSSE